MGIDRAHNAIKRTGLYSRAVVEWEACPEVNKTWPEWKEHFIEAYEAREASGVTSGGAGYHGASNVYDDEVTLDESLAQIHVANNAAMQGVQSNLSTISDETRELRAALVATQQQLANLMAGNSTVSTGWAVVRLGPILGWWRIHWGLHGRHRVLRVREEG